MFLESEVILCLALMSLVSGSDTLPPTCDSNIYCYGELLHTVQMASIFSDSKTFVDMKLKYPPNETLQRFDEMMNRTKKNPTRFDIEVFLNDTFEPAGSEFEEWDPEDWVEHPAFLDRIHDPDLRDWARKLNLLWKFLGRKIRTDVKNNPDHYSIIYVPNPVIVPGGRFREFYYWDSYWIVRGLLVSQMYNTVKGMLHNLLSIVDLYGFIPNGGRKYYAMRSQPPLLIPMIKSYVDETKDIDFVKEHIVTMEKEFQHWMVNHTIKIEKDGVQYKLARYFDLSSGPRPESYREDYTSAQIFRTAEEKEAFYSELKTAAESGWDFSTRWFILNATNKGNLTNLKVRYIIPVDLNSIIFWNAKILSDFFMNVVNDAEKSSVYEEIAEQWKEAVTKVLWHEEVGAWLDYDTINEIKRDYFYPSNLAPLWTGCYYQSDMTSDRVAKIMKYLEKSQIMTNQGGIPTTMEHSGEQWDYPNAWPPLQYIMIMGLNATGDDWAKALALELTERWVHSNYKAFNSSEAMFEKYDATVPGGFGGGGEYEVQLGFGWTNGIILEFLDKYGDILQPEDQFNIQAARLAGVGIMSAATNLVLVCLSVAFLLSI
ncbi:trehalase-like [Schistocerca americana]|uniref:trehalase-like n=1 Tax=Schistocerca americana TaxID=7009 RepID=UPI001F4FE099|nr:trehalase-like [Schistocerca americana]XP_046987729.1 trehalase-like [Schistocerca americana]